MKKLVFIRIMVLLLAGALLGLLALCAAYALPTSGMTAHLQWSASTFEQEGTYYLPMQTQEASKLDNYTDSLFLNMAYTSGGKGILDDALSSYTTIYNEDDNQIDSFLRLAAGEKGGKILPENMRFWNGYQIILKPLLLFLSYPMIRQMNLVLETSLVVLICFLAAKAGKRTYILPFLFTYICLNPISVALNMFFSCIFYSTFIPCAIMLWKNERIAKGMEYYLFFELIGICTAYFNMNMSQIMTLAIPLTLYYILNGWPETVVDGLKSGISLSASWGVGYVGMLAAKGVLGSLFTSFDVMGNIIKTIRFRTSSTDIPLGNEIIGEVSWKEAISLNGKDFITGNKFLIAIVIIFVSYVMISAVRENKELSIPLVGMLTGIVIFMMPFIWYSCTINHCFIHHSFTFRSLSVCVFVFSCLPLIIREYTEKSTRI